MFRSILVPLTLVAFAVPASAQSLIIRGQVGGPPAIHWGRLEIHPPNPNPYAGRTHGPSLYQNYGSRRLEGRVLWMPAGIAPPGPQALERFTIGRIGPEPSRATPAPPAIPRRYGHPSYSRISYARTSYGRSSYVRKP